jgi:hypothetical protein
VIPAGGPADYLQEQLIHAMSEKTNIEGQVTQVAEQLTASRDEIAAERRAAEALAPLEMRPRRRRKSQCYTIATSSPSLPL